MQQTRRHFLATSLAATIGPSTIRGAEQTPTINDTVRIGVIGTGVRGKYLIGNLPESARVVAICDCATSHMADTLHPQGDFAQVLARFHKADAPRCVPYQDYRRMLDREKLDAVIIATPDHHHTLAAMLALGAGLDVYLEKPMTVTIGEGRLLANLVKRSGGVLQVGSQQRSMELNRFACDFLRNGGLGKILKVELPNYPGPLPNASYAAEPIPDGLDWDLFLGPTPVRPHNRRLWVKDEFDVGDLKWRGWDLFRDYSGHLMTNWGAHNVDMVQSALGRDDTGPTSIRVHRPESLRAIWMEWKSKTPAPISPDERRFWPVEMRYVDGIELHFTHDIDFIRFHGERGTMIMRRNFFEADPPELVTGGPDPEIAERWSGPGHVARPHLENWLDCIRSRGAPVAPVEVGHRTATICHLANIARELNRPLEWNPAEERFDHDEQANGLLNRPRRRGFELPT